MNEYAFKLWLGGAIPTGNKEFTFNRDSLEMLLRMAWEAGVKEGKEVSEANRREQEFEDKHGPRSI